MWNEDKIISYLKCNLKEKRFIHSIGVRDTAEKLAVRYKIDSHKARIAGLVHDCAKNLSDEALLKIVMQENKQVDKVCKVQPQLLHGEAGSIMAKNIMNIFDDEILSAVKYHTTAKENMTILEKIIYIADYIEPSRDFQGVEKLRQLVFEDLDRALIQSFDNTIKFVISKKQLIHPCTISARNYLILER
ncbi:bis(5'-nucleosyl)-tetraphosphatase (symmetrical) YqeK [Haloimpatiens sp. FM7330]|uniref:bis(5'-nucleosyl)-tetraphosphatase (symmetrical) YqeK n=1 Tax=Haloimpatiens sp. FM7330 TaxID=3298610 RepID=UPI003644166A